MPEQEPMMPQESQPIQAEIAERRHTMMPEIGKAARVAMATLASVGTMAGLAIREGITPAFAETGTVAANSSDKLPSVYSDKIHKWSIDINRRCPEQWGISQGHTRSKHKGSLLTLKKNEKDQNVFSLYLKKSEKLCASLGITGNNKAQINALHYVRSTKRNKIYRYTSDAVINSNNSTEEIQVALKP